MAELIDKDLGVYVSAKHNAVITTQGVSASKSVKGEGEQPVKKVTGSAVGISFWGDENLEPQTKIAKIRVSNQIASALEWKSKSIISGGLIYGYDVVDEKTGEVKFKQIIDFDIDSWNKNTAINRYLRESMLDFYAFNNVFPKMRSNLGMKFIHGIECPNTCDVRLGIQNKTNGKIDKAYINANWDLGVKWDDKDYVKEYSLIDPYFNAEEQVRNLKGNEFLYPVQGPDFDYTFYSKPAWHSIFESGWLDVAMQIPKFKAALLKRQYTIKYHIDITETFWSWKFPEFNQITDPAKRKKFVEDYMDQMDKMLAGTDQAGANFLSFSEVDPVSKKPYPGITITTIDDKIKDGIYVEDSQEASSHIYSALGIDGSLIGSMPGKQMGAGSGSDKRVAMNIYLANEKPVMDQILEPINFIYNFNWGNKPEYKGKMLKAIFKNYWLATQDVSKEPQQQAK